MSDRIGFGDLVGMSQGATMRRVLGVVNKWQLDVNAFMSVSGQERPSTVNFEGWPADLRCDLLMEEMLEILVAVDERKKAETPAEKEKAEADIVDGLVDLIYVAIGTASAAGVNLSPFWDEVHAANMRKFINGVVKNASGKVLKPEGWVGPDIVARLREAKGGAK